MKKKIVLGLAAAGTAIALLPMFAAFEAHVINVTARIENALSVTTDNIDYGTVFPQQERDEDITIDLSQSFRTEGRVDDVEYMIRQKPKCAITRDEGRVLVGPTRTGHVLEATSTPNDLTDYYINCGEPPRPLVEDPGDPVVDEDWGPLPLLCPYLSKHKHTDDPDVDQQSPVDHEIEVDAFHQPWTVVNDIVNWVQATGRLAKSEGDFGDHWNIDLRVPCFGDHCAQDWEEFVEEWNPLADPDDYVQPIENEHKIFGCDLWVEVTDVSLNQCTDTVDNDGDTLVDLADPGCTTGNIMTEADND